MSFDITNHEPPTPKNILATSKKRNILREKRLIVLLSKNILELGERSEFASDNFCKCHCESNKIENRPE